MNPVACNALGESLLPLYELAQDCAIDVFQDAALREIEPLIGFDSAMWGGGHYGTESLDIHTLHLFRQPIEMLQAYEEVKHLDTAAGAIALQPRATMSFNADSWFDAPVQAPLRAYGRRFQQSNFFITARLQPISGGVEWISLFRANRDAHCGAAEQQRLHALAPHLLQALALNRRAHLDRLQRALMPQRGLAIASLQGRLQHADGAFEDHLRSDCPGWRGGQLPSALVQALAQPPWRFVGPCAVFNAAVGQGLLFLRSRQRCAADALTAREQLIARLATRGLTHKQIAQGENRAPATVRNQLQAIYQKLAVHNLAELIAALQQAD